jgi:hypothetical protein
MVEGSYASGSRIEFLIEKAEKTSRCWTFFPTKSKEGPKKRNIHPKLEGLSYSLVRDSYSPWSSSLLMGERRRRQT